MEMLEDEVIHFLCQWLQNNGWKIESMALGRAHGDDIRASKNGHVLLVEAKGARGNPENLNVVRDEFDLSQIRDHLGKAIVKALELKAERPHALVAIAHPVTDKILKIVKPVAGQLRGIEILFAFVAEDGGVEWFGQPPLASEAV